MKKKPSSDSPVGLVYHIPADKRTRYDQLWQELKQARILMQTGARIEMLANDELEKLVRGCFTSVANGYGYSATPDGEVRITEKERS